MYLWTIKNLYYTPVNFGSHLRLDREYLKSEKINSKIAPPQCVPATPLAAVLQRSGAYV